MIATTVPIVTCMKNNNIYTMPSNPIQYSSQDNWNEIQKLIAVDGTAQDHFGYSVSIDGDTALIGAESDDEHKGSAYVFTRTENTWTQQTKLTDLEGAAFDYFSQSVSINGNTALIAAFGDDEYKGSAYVFTRIGTTWTQQVKLLASDGTFGDLFGYDVALSGETALIGAPDDDGIGEYSGSAYVFTRESENLPSIMLTGYWNPTGQMIAPFSNNTYLNPEGWKGANWENRGYNIYSFFPAPEGYNGDFEIDYQDTLSDFLRITTQIKPIAIISFGSYSSGNGMENWEIEYNARNLKNWHWDKKFPYWPNPRPPDNSLPVGYIRHSSLPVQKIEDVVNDRASIKAKVDWMGDPGAYLCEYMAYLGMRYQSLHHNDNLNPCKAAGFIHVNNTISLEKAMEATNITIRETIKYLNGEEQLPETPTITGPLNGKIKTQYKYTFKTADPNYYNVKYFIDWEDGNLEWTDYYSSNENVYVNHTWTKKGTYTIMAMAMNTHGSISQWGTLSVTMPKTYILNTIIQLLMKKSVRFPIFEKILNQYYN